MFISNSPGNPISIVVVAFFSGTVMSWTGLFTRAPIRKPTAAPTARSTISKFRLITPIKDEQHLLQALLLLRKRPPNLLAITFTPFWASLRIEWMLISAVNLHAELHVRDFQDKATKIPLCKWRSKRSDLHLRSNRLPFVIWFLVQSPLLLWPRAGILNTEYWIQDWTGVQLKLYLWFNRTPKPTVVNCC